MKKFLLTLSILVICLTGCSGEDIDHFFSTDGENGDGVVGYTNRGAVNNDEMTALEFERIHYGAAVIQDEDKFLFSNNDGYEFPQLISTEEEWDLLQDKLNIDMGDIDFDEYIVFGHYEHNLWNKTTCLPVLIEDMSYSDETLYFGWRWPKARRFAAEDEEDALCGFDLVKIRRADFPLESRAVFGAEIEQEEMEDDTTIIVESDGYYLLY
ncbi:MAG: hypothetical protein ACI4DO_03730 [Roseburia sp.]